LAVGRAVGSRRSPRWMRSLRARVMLSDALAVYAAVFAAFFLRWGIGELVNAEPLTLTNRLALLSLGLIGAWYAALALADAWDVKLMGSGSAEYTRVWNATFGMFGLLAIFAYLTRWDLGRSFVAIALPLGLLFLGLGRHILRRRLVRDREAGRAMSQALLVGSPATADHFIRQLAKAPESGLDIVAICTPVTNSAPSSSGEVLGDEYVSLDTSELRALGREPLEAQLHSLDDVVPYVADHDIDTVIVSGSDQINPQALKRLSWALEPLHVELILAPELTDIASERVTTRNVAGLSLLHVNAPGYTSSQQRIKRVFDIIGSLISIIVFSIPLAVTALAIKLTSRGPILFKQNRIGENGKPFKVFKFRSMYADAEARLQEVLGGKVGLFYKPKNDPRITPVGKFIRRYSIDELPQLFNVLFGTMSMVGPRPQIPAEVEQYEDGIERRLFVKPGMTGLWQVSGRNNLSVEESMRLDLYYVENWSLTEDMLILAKTAKAVIGKDGAY